MATRLYFAATTGPTGAITPGYAGWTRTSEGIRRWMGPVKDGSTLNGKTFWAAAAAAANDTCLCVQLVSDRLAAGIAFDTGDTIKCVVQGRESATNDNINRSPICVKVYSEDGTTLRATLLGLGHVGPNTTEWLSTGLRNKQFADGDTLTASYTTVNGDRLVVEIGGQVSGSAGSSVTGTLNIGSSAGTDLSENETETTANDPWFEISQTLTFGASMPADAGAYTVTGTAVTLTHGSHFGLVASPYISASAADVTTARLTAPSGKSTSDFDAGFISDDTNPLPTIDITADDYTEVEWCIEAAASGLTQSDVYQFRVVQSDNTALDTYTVTPTWTIGAPDYPMTASAGSYAITGTTTPLSVSMVPAGGSYALTGATVALLAGMVLVPDSGAYAITGTDATFARTYVVTAESGTYSITGATTPLSLSMVPAAGSYTITGTDVSLLYGFRVAAETTSYDLTGTDVGLLAARLLSPETTAYAVTGTATGLLAGYVATAGAGSYAVTGTDVTLTYSSSAAFTLAASAYIAASAADVTTARLTAPSGKTSGADFQAGLISDDTNPLPTLDLGSGKYTELEWCVTADAGLSLDDVYQFRLVQSDDTALDTYTVTPTWTIGVVDYPLTADAGAYTITGSTVGLVPTRLLVPEAGAYALTGTDVAFGYEHEIFPESGVYTFTGTAVALTPQSPGGTYVITGSDITLGRTLVLAVPTTTTYAIAGADVTLRYGAVVVAGSSSYTITGDVVDLVYDMAGAFNMPANAGSYALTGTAVTLRNAKRLNLDVGSYALTGTTVTLLRDSHIDPAAGAYTTTGATVVMLLTGNSAYAMAAEGGTYTSTGRPVDMRYGNTPPPDRDHWGRRPRCRPIIGGRR